MPQLNADVTPAVKKKVEQLERELSAESAREREIIAVLIEAATAKAFPVDALKAYRKRFEAEKKRRSKL
jgi:adenine-specific DNA methylase